MRKKILLLGLLLGWTVFASAQADSLRLSKNYQFKDGIYLTFDDFKRNQPSYSWDSLRVSIFSNPQTFLAQVEYVEATQADGIERVDLDAIWGFSLGGIPYIRLPRGATQKTLPIFAGLRLRGKICYYSYETEEQVMLRMPVYNPLTGRPFQVGQVERTRKVKNEWMLNFENGEIAKFTVNNFREWIKDDQQLLRTIADLTEAEAQEKLFQCLLIYVDRNAAYLEE